MGENCGKCPEISVFEHLSSESSGMQGFLERVFGSKINKFWKNLNREPYRPRACGRCAGRKNINREPYSPREPAL
jgi:hypothetical protein